MNLKSWNCTCQCIVVMGNKTSIIIRYISISFVAIGTSAVALIKGKNPSDQSSAKSGHA